MSGWESHLPAVQALLRKAIDAGLIAAAAVYQREVKKRIRPGYTTGAWVTGTAHAAVMVSEIEDTPGGRLIRVGVPGTAKNIETGRLEDMLYVLAWEMGWTPRVVKDMAGLAGGTVAGPVFRKEIWRPALVETAEQMRAAFVRAYNRVMQGGGGLDIGAVEVVT